MVDDPHHHNGAELDEARELARVEQRLVADFSPPLSPELVHRVVVETVATWAGAPVRHYVPLLTERAARRQLRDVVADAASDPPDQLRSAG
jgi:hypothetical protein